MIGRAAHIHAASISQELDRVRTWVGGILCGELRRCLQQASVVSREYPVVVSKFETHAREVEIDGVADRGELVLWAISEHIEDAGATEPQEGAGLAGRFGGTIARLPQRLVVIDLVDVGV